MVTGYYIDIYECNSVFAWDTSEAELNEFFEKNNVPEKDKEQTLSGYRRDDASAYTSQFMDTDVITILKDNPTPKTIAHEIFHQCNLIMKQRGIEDEEAWAYLIGNITKHYYELRESCTQETDEAK